MKRSRAVIFGVVLLLVGAVIWLFLSRSPQAPSSRAVAAGAASGTSSATGDGASKKSGAANSPGPFVAGAVARVATDGGEDAGAARDPSVFAKFGWGGGPNQLGRDRPQEGNPEGPMSVNVDPLGRPVILDQVNGRLVVMDEQGQPTRTVPLPVQAAQDVAMTSDGKAVVLDRLSDKTVAIMDESGKVLGELPVEGKGIEEGGGVTGVFVDGEDVYVERENASLVRVGDTSGRPDPDRPEIPGRPSRDGKLYLHAGLGDAAAGKVYVTAISRETQDHLYTREYGIGVPLFGILALDTDLQGIIYLGLLAETQPKPAVFVLCLAPADGNVIGQAQLPANELPEESFRDLAVLDEGGVIYAHRTESGVEYLRADCR